MALPSRLGAAHNWVITPMRSGGWQARCTLSAATDVTEPLTISDMPITTVHIFGDFNSTNISLLGYNADPNNATDVAAATPQVLHRADDPASTFSAVATELMASIVETPRFIIAKANGAVTTVYVVITAYSQDG